LQGGTARRGRGEDLNLPSGGHKYQTKRQKEYVSIFEIDRMEGRIERTTSLIGKNAKKKRKARTFKRSYPERGTSTYFIKIQGYSFKGKKRLPVGE